MKLYLDTENRILSNQPGGGPLEKLAAKRGDSLLLDIFPSQPLPPGALGLLAAKPKGSYRVPPVALAPAWIRPKTNMAGWRFVLNLDTAELDALYEGDKAEVELMAEVTWQADGITFTTQTFFITVAHDVWRGDEPMPLPGATRFVLTAAADASRWAISITPDGQLITTKIA